VLYPSRPFATERKRFAPKHGSCRVARLLCFSFLSWHGKSNAYHLCTSPQNIDTRVPYAFRCWERVGIPALYAAQIETLSRPRESAFHHLQLFAARGISGARPSRLPSKPACGRQARGKQGKQKCFASWFHLGAAGAKKREFQPGWSSIARWVAAADGLRFFPAGAGISDRLSSPFAKGARDKSDALRMTPFRVRGTLRGSPLQRKETGAEARDCGGV